MIANEDNAALYKLGQIAIGQIVFIKGAFRDADPLMKTCESYSIDAFSHFVWLKAVGESVQNSLRSYTKNGQCTASLLQVVQSRCRKTIFQQ